MAILKVSEIRKFTPEERQKRLHDLELQLIKYRSKVLAGGQLENPGIIKAMRKTIARFKTIEHEEYLQSLQGNLEDA